jgi:hypothetical protein
MPSCASYCHFPHPDSACSLVTHEPWSARRQGRIRYFGRQGRAGRKSRRNATPGTGAGCYFSVIVWALSLCFTSPVSPLHFLFLSLRIASYPLSLPHPLSTPEHSITTIKMGLACGVSAFTASQMAGGMCMPLGDSLDTAGSAETAAMLLTGGFVEMAWTVWTAWCYLGPPCRRPPLSCPLVGAGAGARHDYVACVHLSCTQVPSSQ